MSASVVTYAAIEAAVALRADIVIGTGRWTTALLSDQITRSLKKWLQLVVDAGDDTYLKISRVTTNPSAVIDADGWQPRQWIAAPAGCFAIRGIDVYDRGASAPTSMLTFSEAERNDGNLRGEWWSETNTGTPRFYRQGGLSASAPNLDLIQIFPWADAAYTCDIRYIPALPPTVAASTYDFICGGEEFVILDAALQCLVRDGRAGTAEYMAGLREERSRVEQNVLLALSRRSTFKKRDTWLERRAARGAWRGW